MKDLIINSLILKRLVLIIILFSDASVVPPLRKEAPFTGGIILGRNKLNKLKESQNKRSHRTRSTNKTSTKNSRIQKNSSKENSILRLKFKFPVSAAHVPRCSIADEDEDQESENSLNRSGRESRKRGESAGKRRIVLGASRITQR